jgi:cobalt-precorrin-5B (C1)-methyltransferase
MGDFVGGMLKYIRRHKLAKVTIAGGFAKMTKLGQGLLDLHSRRGAVDLDWLAARSEEAGGDAALSQRIRAANTALEALEIARGAGIDLGAVVAEAAWAAAAKALRDPKIALEVAIFDRAGALLARTPFRPTHH